MACGRRSTRNTVGISHRETSNWGNHRITPPYTGAAKSGRLQMENHWSPPVYFGRHADSGVLDMQRLNEFILFAAILAICGCSGSERSAIERVISMDKQISDETIGAVPDDGTPSNLAFAISQYCGRAEKQDVSDCPADFQVAYKYHVRAWREAQAAVNELPDDFLSGLFMGAMNGIFRGETDGGTARLEGDLKQANEKINSTWMELEKIAAAHDIAPQKLSQ